ncbi:MAG: RDD family protein [Bacteroidetes bacterium]|nr:MAG: RDD family protein [Bacteroidota bacterium]
MEEITNTEEVSTLADELDAQITYTYASTGQRFLNFLIDNVLMNYGLSYLTGTAAGFLIAALFPDFARKISSDSSSFDLLLLGYIIALINYLVYYTICERAFKGYTLGKLITGTRVIRDDGGELTLKDALLRTLSRLVPFEAFSAFGGHPWHDLWTKTSVIKTR